MKTVAMELEQQAISFGDAVISMYRIRADSEPAEREFLHRHSYYELHLLLRGEHTFSIGDCVVPVRSGEIVIISPETDHKAVVDESVQRVVLSLTVKKGSGAESVYAGLIKALTDNLNRAIPLDREQTDLIVAYDRTAAAQGGMAVLRRKLDVCAIVVGLFDALGYGDEKKCARQGVDFHIALEAFVEQSNASLKQIADSLGYSQRHIARKIKERYGKSFSQIRREKYEASGSHL